MIKLTVDSRVLAAMKKAFPKPAMSAERAFKKYVSVLETMLTKSLQFPRSPIQQKQGWYAISLQQLANSGGQIGSIKIRVHKWLRDNDLALIETVEQGSAFTGRFSEVKLSTLVTAINTLKVQGSVIATKTTDQALDDYLTGDELDNHQLFNHLYPDYRVLSGTHQFDETFDPLPVDIPSLKSYMTWLADNATKINAAEKSMALRQAKIILGVASVYKSIYLQRRKPSVFGRIYYEGTSVQNINKELRRAVMGNCWEYDIRSSVVSWKMGYAKIYIDSLPGLHDLRKEFSATLSFLEDKEDFMATIRHSVFLKESRVPKNLQTDLLKQSFTAISFGAKHNKSGWPNDQGGWTNSAISDIIKNSEERERFVLDATVVKFTEEQNALDTFIVSLVKLQRSDLLKREILQTKNGHPSKSKILAYLYQHDETEIMDVVRETAAENDRYPIANVHDAIFFKRRLGVELKHEIEMRMQEYSANPYWRLKAKQIERYSPRSLDEEAEIAAHKLRIQEEERIAKDFFKNIG
jgi:hypothetical protein